MARRYRSELKPLGGSVQAAVSGKPMQRIFTGGFGGSGTRVIAMVLRDAGYDIGPTNSTLDWMGGPFVAQYDSFHRNRGSTQFRDYLLDHLGQRKAFGVKFGTFMYCFPELRGWFPGCKLILMRRNPWDQMVSLEYKMDFTYGGLPHSAALVDRIAYWCDVTRTAMEHADLTVCLEELCDHPHKVISEILDVAGVDELPDRFVSIVQRPPTIGRGREHYHLISQLKPDMCEWMRGLYGVTEG